MRSIVHPVLAAVGLAALLALGVGGCSRGAKPPPAPTPEQVKSGVQQSMERVRNDPNLTPQQKEQALRMLEGMAASAQQQQRRDDDE